ncbi:MAG: hypothetical protein H7834_11560 [Magnetococcus sp. YQC-9]
MNDADKRLVLAVSLVLLTLLFVVQGMAWIDESVQSWEAKARAREVERAEVARLAGQIKVSRGAGNKERAPMGVAKPGEEVISSLLPWLEKETAALQLADKMQQIAPIPLKGNESPALREKADLTVKGIPMETAIRLLIRLEAQSRLRVVRADLKRAEKDAPGVSLSLEVGLL